MLRRCSSGSMTIVWIKGRVAQGFDGSIALQPQKGTLISVDAHDSVQCASLGHGVTFLHFFPSSVKQICLVPKDHMTPSLA